MTDEEYQELKAKQTRMKTNKGGFVFGILLGITILYFSFSIIFPKRIEKKYFASYSFYKKVINDDWNMIGQSFEMNMLSLLGEGAFYSFLNYMGYYVVQMNQDGTIEIDDYLLQSYRTKKYRISPLGVVYISTFIPYGYLSDNRLYLFYDKKWVYLEESKGSTGNENYSNATEELLKSI